MEKSANGPYTSLANDEHNAYNGDNVNSTAAVVPQQHTENPFATPVMPHDDSHLPTIIFAIPFPVPRHSSSKNPVSPYLLYALPRAPYQKPDKDANGKNIQKEGVVKKVERKWQEEIAEGDRIRKGQEPDAGNWKKFKGKAVGVSAMHDSEA